MKELSRLLTIFFILIMIININGTHSEEGLKREELPVKIRDEAWTVVENIQKVIALELEIDLSRRSGKVTKNVTAQFTLNNLIPKILIFSNDVTEQSLVHEILHAKRVIDGHPVLYEINFPLMMVISNLQNAIEHIVIYRELEKLGFDVRTHSITKWRKDFEILKSSLDKLKKQYPKNVFNLIGAATTFSGLVDGIELEEIEEKMDERVKDGIANGRLIYDELLKYNLGDKDENLQALLKLSNILGITKSYAGIMRIDYKINTWYDFNPENGKQLSENTF
ncbi:MAG: hypothetical protein ACE5GU_07585 [Candidatus Scalinduaceae bacterium]